MAKAYPSDDEAESIGRLGKSLSADKSRKRGFSKYYQISFKDRDKANTSHEQSQLDGRKKENNTFCRSLGTSKGDKEHTKHTSMQRTKTDTVFRAKDKICQSKTSSSQPQDIKSSDSNSSKQYQISREEKQQTRPRDGNEFLNGDGSLGKRHTNKTKDFERHKMISKEGKCRLHGYTSVRMRSSQKIKDSYGSINSDLKTKMKTNPKKNDSDVRKQCNLPLECVQKMKKKNGSNICDISVNNEQRGNLDGKCSPQRREEGFMRRRVNLKMNHSRDRAQCDFANLKGHDVKTCDKILSGEGQELIKKHDGECGQHITILSETEKTLSKKNDGNNGTKDATSSWTEQELKTNDDDCGQRGDILSGTLQNKTTIDGECGLQSDASSGTGQKITTAYDAVTNKCDKTTGRKLEMKTNYANSDDIFTSEKHRSTDNNSIDFDKVYKQTVMQSTELKERKAISLSELIELSDFHGEPLSLLIEIADRTNGFADIFDTNIKLDLLHYVLKIFGDVSTSSHERTFIELLFKFEDNFLPRLNEVLGEVLIKTKLYACIWEDSTSLCKTCILILKILQILVQTIVSSVGKCKHALLLIKEIQAVFLLNDETLSKRIQNTNDIISMTVQEIDCRRTLTMSTLSKDLATATGPPEDFRELSILPTIDDIQTNINPFLRAVRPTGKYETLDLYLDIQFRLLREDFIFPLRNGITEYVQNLYDLTPNKKIREIKVYKNVKIICPTYENEEVSHLLEFDMSNLKGVDWTDSRRLLIGSLLCLSCDNFRTLSFATVVNRNIRHLLIGLVEVHFEKVPMTNRSPRFVMIESTSYFEAYRHILAGLQSVDSSLSFQRYILDCNSIIKPPSYLLGVGVPLYDFACILPNKSQNQTRTKIPVLNTVRWPSLEDLRLDKSQYEALQLALTKELTIIQGPPGTGKTFIGLQIAKVLLENKSYWKDSSAGGTPILVVCNTNHALDQFLEGILPFCKGSIVRVGTRCKNTALEPYMLNNAKKNGPQLAKKEYHFKMKDVHEEQQSRERHVADLVLAQRKTFTEVQSFNSLLEHMIDKQRAEFEFHNTDANLLMAKWLKIHPSPLSHKNISEDEGARLLWIAYIHDDVEKMMKHETNRVSDIHKLDLLRRAELYKAWLAEFQSRAHTIISSHIESKVRIESLKRTLQKTFIHPIDMLKYIKSKQTKSQLNKIRRAVDFEAWLAIDGSDYSTDDIYLIYRDVICDTETTPRNWVWNWNAKYESANITEISMEVRDLSDKKATSMTNMRSLPIADRRSLYWHWVGKLRGRLKMEVELTKETYREMPRAIAKIREQETRDLLRRKNVIGMTTTGAAKNRKLLQSIQPAIIIVEEAAQVLESHIVTALNENCKHLILIGDHQQLRPSTTVYHLAQKYHLDISLFERMVLNDIPCVTLSEQHRMRPEVSVLLKNEYLYPELRDHKAVYEYDSISGVDSDVFFIEHSEKEVHIDDSASYQNPYEANFTVRLCIYLLKQGYERTQVTILTPYIGQVTLLKKEMRNLDIRDVHVTAVDNFQGEENDIILLSLVRSSKTLKRKNQIGFLAIANRVCVALSRAKKGFYVIGNFSLMKEYSLLWKHNVSLMAQNNKIGQEITLRCQNHPKTIIQASKPEDFNNAPEGGCTEPCLTTLKCNHVCPKICHVIDRDHASAKCEEACELSLTKCGHKCKKRCFEKCDPCTTSVEKEVSFCGHRVYMPCSLDPDDWMCQMNCDFRLQCGHVCCRKCNECKSKNDHENFCKTRVEKELKCGHAPQVVQCYQDPHCTELCCVSLPCGHVTDMTCYYKTNCLDKYKCTKRVSKQLLCGHILELPCFKDPSTVVCTEQISVTLLCGHVVEILCSQNSQNVICSEPCGTELSCRHICIGTCGTCFGGKIHQPCLKKCQKNLPCGHKCSHRCGDICPPCNLPCEWICSHGTKCKKKCSENCDPCLKKCSYRCIHSSCTKLCYELCDKRQCNKRCTKKLTCGHTCIGLCGELCVCSEFCSVKENKIYYRNDRDTVYIKMPQCGCIIPQNVLDDYMNRPPYARDDMLKRCMVCRKVVSSCIQRYSNTIKLTLNDVYQELKSMKVSEKVSGTRRYKYILFNRVHRLRDIGLGKADINILKKRLNVSTFDTLNVIEKTVDLLVELLMVSQNLPAELVTDLVIKPIDLEILILEERNYYAAQLWEEIRNEIKRMQDLLSQKNLHQVDVDDISVEECSDCDTDYISDNEDYTT